MKNRNKLLVVSGMSGSGKSTALNALEDVGYYCVDNLPVDLLPALAREMRDNRDHTSSHTAVGIDARTPPVDLERLPAILEQLRVDGIDCEVLFLDANDPTLLKRYSETRRKHPLSQDQLPLDEAIQRERRLLEPLARLAHLKFETSHTNQHQLRDRIVERLAQTLTQGLSLLFLSFGFKHGIAANADFVFDLRCLPNPHWQPELRPLTGRDPEVAAFLDRAPLVETMFQDLSTFLGNWIPRFEADKRSYLTIALGCTGGQHRSVYMTERLAAHFGKQHDSVLIRHRELP